MNFFSATLLMSSLFISASQAGEVYNRRADQQNRIAEGVANGSLRPWETAKLGREEGAINREIARDASITLEAYSGRAVSDQSTAKPRQQADLPV